MASKGLGSTQEIGISGNHWKSMPSCENKHFSCRPCAQDGSGSHPNASLLNIWNTNNQNVSLKDYRGRVTVMFFGYTACPDNCPITLSVLKQVVVSLNKQADKLQVLFITIDPKKDTPEKMKNYLSAFQPNFIGLTGTKEEILKVAENYGSAFMKNPKSFDSELNYLLIHTGNIYLIDQSGKVNEVYSQDTKVEEIVHGIKKLLVSN